MKTYVLESFIFADGMKTVEEMSKEDVLKVVSHMAALCAQCPQFIQTYDQKKVKAWFTIKEERVPVRYKPIAFIGESTPSEHIPVFEHTAK